MEVLENLKSKGFIVGVTNSEKLNVEQKYLINNKTPFVNYCIENRINPKVTMENCNSIIVVGMPYKINSFNDKTKAKVASGYLQYDYHKKLKSVLIETVENIQEKHTNKSDFMYKIFVDTGPLIERELGKKAGLGVIGKNRSLINKKIGSSFFIGYIMTNLVLPINEEVKDDFCKSCEKCLKACPSKCLKKYKNETYIESQKCVSYLTQKKEDLTEEEKKVISNSLYGCDICLVVCPHNKKNLIHNNNNHIDFSEFESLSNKQFKEKFQNTGIYWRGKKTIVRNSKIGAKNV